MVPREPTEPMEPAATQESAESSEIWRALLLGTSPEYARMRRLLQRVPGHPRCKMCAAPFGGIGAPFMRLVGRKRWAKNPKYCGACFSMLQANHGGAEIECTLLFADVRGSTTLAEGISPADFSRLMARFYETAMGVLVERDAIVDKFVGDEVMALFIPAVAGEQHAQRAIDAAQALLRATGHEDVAGPWLPVGAGVHTGTAFVGSVGENLQAEITALGDVVNTAARLASSAAGGEILVTEAAASAAGFDASAREHRQLELKGKSLATDVMVIPVGREAAAQASR
jgi:adenylate cyclase